MEINCKIHLKYESELQAQKIQQTVSLDDGSFVCSKIKDSSLVTSINSKNLSSFLHTLDDYLACINVAENIIKQKHK